MGDNLPRRLDRAALDRVLARAAELQASFADSADGSGNLTEQQIVELGQEAGLSPEHLRQALAEERTRGAPPEDRGLAAVIWGPARVGASRVVTGTPGEILDAIDGWMVREEMLQVKRRVGDRIVWEPRRDFLGKIAMGFNFSGRGYALSRAAEVSATATTIDATRSVVAVDASLVERRGQLATGAAITSTVGAGASFVAAVIGIAIPVALIPVVLLTPAAIVGTRRAQSSAVARAQLAHEQLLDHLERGDHRRPGGLLAAITATAAAMQRRR
jgi:hypothetical protein